MNYRTADYAKMQASFGWCSSDFGSFEEIFADMAARVGYGQRGLSALAASVLGLSLPKLKRVGAKRGAPRLYFLIGPQ